MLIAYIRKDTLAKRCNRGSICGRIGSVGNSVASEETLLFCFACSSSLRENSAMMVQEIEAAVSNLSREDLAAFRKRLWEFDQEAWDKEIEEDVAAGRFDPVIREMDEDIRAWRNVSARRHSRN